MTQAWLGSPQQALDSLVTALQLDFVVLSHLQKDATSWSIHKYSNSQQDFMTVIHLTLRVSAPYHRLPLMHLCFPKSMFQHVTLFTRQTTTTPPRSPGPLLLCQVSLPSLTNFILLYISIQNNIFTYIGKELCYIFILKNSFTHYS